MNYWVYTEEGAQGPYDLEAMTGWIQPDHPLCPEGGTDWTRAGDVPEVAARHFAAAPSNPPGPPAPSDSPPAGDWYLTTSRGDSEGPMEIADLRERIRSGVVAPDALLRHKNWKEARKLNETRLFARIRGKDNLSELHWELYEIALYALDDELRAEHKIRFRDYHPPEREILEAEAKSRGLVKV